VSVVALLVLLAAGVGTAVGLAGSHLSSSPNLMGIAGQMTGPSPTPSPSPTASPEPTGPPGTLVFPSPVISTVPFQPGPPQSTESESVPVPAGWTVSSQDSNSITLDDPNGVGSVTVASGPSNPRQTAEQYRDSINQYFERRYPDTGPCPNSAASVGALNGAPGIIWVLCFTMTAGGQSFPAACAIFAGANSSGSVYYLVSVLTSQGNLQSYVAEAQPVVQGIQWKLK